MTGRYEELHTRSISDPESFWGDAAREIDWIRPWDTVLDDSNPPFYRWFKGGVLNTCYNAVDRHVEAGRGEQPAHHLRQPGHRHGPDHHLCRAARPGRDASPGRCAAWASSKGDRVIIYMPMIPRRSSPCWPAPGSAPSTRSCSAASPRTSWRPASTTPSPRSSSRRRAASRRAGSSRTSRCSTRPSSMATHKPEHCVIFQRPQETGDAGAPAATSTGTTRSPARSAGRLRAGRSHRSALHPLHLGHDRQAQGRRPRQRRPRGGAEVDDEATSTASSRARCSGPPPTSAGWSATPTSSTRPLLHGCTTILFEGKPVGTPDAGAFWRVIAAAQGARRCSPRPPRFRAIKREDPDGELHRRSTTCRASARCSWPASAPTPTRCAGPRST